MRSVTSTRADARDAADVVAAQVDEHDVLGDLLRIGAQLALQLASSRSSVPRGRVPAIGRTVSSRPSRRTITSGEAPSTVRAPRRRKNMYGDGFNGAQAAIDVERVGAQRRTRSAAPARPG